MDALAKTTTHTTCYNLFLRPDKFTSNITLNNLDSAQVALANSTGGANSLPVELNSFSSVVKDGIVTLVWATALEVANYGFTIQRSKELSGTWIEIGFVPGAGNSNSPKNYIFRDTRAVSGANLYRPKQVNTDGSYHTYSPILSHINASADFSLYQNYPNPFNPATTIRFAVPTLPGTAAWNLNVKFSACHK